MRAVHLVLVAALLLAGPSLAADEPEDKPEDKQQETRDRMGEIFEAMSYLLPLSLDEEGFSDPAQREHILEALSLLARSSSSLASHGSGRDAAFAHLSRSLAVDARDIERRFRAGGTQDAQALVRQLTGTCVACHSRLESPADSSLSERFVSTEQVAKLQLDERAKLQYATRQFDDAMKSYEELFASPDAKPWDLDLMGDLDDYLELCIRVRQDPARAERTFALFAKRPDLPEALAAEVDHWVVSLRDLQKRPPAAGSLLDQARALLRETEDGRFTDERDALVIYTKASSLLHTYVADGAHPPDDLAEAYLLLGVIESRVGRSFWLSEAEAFFETAIRLAPGEPVGERAYRLLEDYLIAGYTGSGGAQIPEEVEQKLAELRALVAKAQAEAAARKPL